MASQFTFGEDNGTAAGSPAKGTTRTLGRSECNWKNIDDSTTAYSSQPITAGGNSFVKYQFGVISGTFNTVSNGKFAHTAGAFGDGLTLRVHITSGYSAPVTGTLTSGLNMTPVSTIAISGQSVLFGQNGPEQATVASLSAVATGYSQYLVTQLQTTTGTSPGDTASATLTFQFDES